jgi:hypothetical protein
MEVNFPSFASSYMDVFNHMDVFFILMMQVVYLLAYISITNFSIVKGLPEYMCVCE